MAQLWKGRFKKELAKETNDFNASIHFDSRMYKEDITGSMAHATMLGACGIIEKSESEKIVQGLSEILADIESGKLAIDPGAEDIHTFVESELTARLGQTGKRLHTARSRNDQVALDIRMTLKKEIDAIAADIKDLLAVLCKKAEENKGVILPGYPHLQRAQPIAFGHHLMAYAAMLCRDLDRLADVKKRMNVLPLGSGALAGTTYPINRQMVAAQLGFDDVSANSLDGVSDRDFCIELAAALSLVMVHLSRFSEEIIMWCSWEFKYVDLDDAYSTGSSIMPQKKNPDVAELVRGKTGRVYGALVTLLTMMKSLPLAYNKDMQEDKEAIFDAIDTVELCLPVFAAMVDTLTVRPKNMAKAAAGGFINATDCADYLTKKGLPFREAYMIVGRLVNMCIKSGDTLDTLTLKDFRAISSLFDEDVYDALALKTCVNERKVYGGPAKESVQKQIELIRQFVGEHTK